MLRKGMTLAEVMVSVAIIGFLLTLIVQIVILYNQFSRNSQKTKDVSTEGNLLAGRISQLMKVSEKGEIQVNQNDEGIVIRINDENKEVLGAIGFYGIGQRETKYWRNEFFIGNVRKEYKMIREVYPEIVEKNGMVIVSVYGDIYNGLLVRKDSKPRKVPFGTFHLLKTN